MTDRDGDRPSTRVVSAVAEAEGVDQSDLAHKLNDVVDPDALDSLFAPAGDGTGRSDGRVEFVYLGYEVTVDADGTVEVEATD